MRIELSELTDCQRRARDGRRVTHLKEVVVLSIIDPPTTTTAPIPLDNEYLMHCTMYIFNIEIFHTGYVA